MSASAPRKGVPFRLLCSPRNSTGRCGACARASEMCMRSTSRVWSKVAAAGDVGYANVVQRSCGIAIGRDTRCTRCRIVREAGSTATSATSPLRGLTPCSVIEGRSMGSEMQCVADQEIPKTKDHSPFRVRDQGRASLLVNVKKVVPLRDCFLSVLIVLLP